jgi:hypothetical protein
MTAAPIAMRPVFGFTRHAVDRYIERLCGGKRSPGVALVELYNAARRAVPVPRLSWHGNALWSVDVPAMRLVAVMDEGRAIVVTVIDGADDGIEAEKIEYDALRVRRLLARIPELGQQEATSPVPQGEGDYRAWVGLESRRLDVERKRLGALRDALMTPKERMAHIRLTHADRRAEREQGRAHAMAEQDRAIKRRNELLDAMAARLAEVDAGGSSELLERMRALREPPTT